MPGTDERFNYCGKRSPGKLYTEGLRLIIDESGGLEHNPIAALVLPSMTIIRDTDEVLK